MSRAQLDMFAEQDDLFPAAPVSYRPDPERVRRKLAVVLDELRGADKMPWDRKRQAYHQQLFPQMTRSLPPEEAEQLKLAFATELKRLS